MQASPARRRSLARRQADPRQISPPQPAILATHAAVGLLMLVAGVSVLTRAVLTRHALAIAASAAGLAGIVAAAVSGDAFVSNSGTAASR